MFSALVAILVLSLFFSNIVLAQEPDVGLAVSGPLLNQEFVCVNSGTIQSYLNIKNTGASDCTFRFKHEIISGPVGSVKVTPPENNDDLHAPESIMKANYTFKIQNASGVVVLRLSITAISTNKNASTATASVASLVRFVIDPDAFTVKIRVLDVWGWPIEGARIQISRDRISYTTQETSENGTTDFLIARGYYDLRLWFGGVLQREIMMNVSESRLWTFTLWRPVVSPDPPETIHALEIIVGLVAGYFLARLEQKRKRKKPKTKTDLLEWEFN